MPSSGLPIETILKFRSDKKNHKVAELITANAEHAIRNGLFVEWLESFVGAWKKTKDPIQSANAGIIEWDM
jgi:hypothetical protein